MIQTRLHTIPVEGKGRSWKAEYVIAKRGNGYAAGWSFNGKRYAIQIEASTLADLGYRSTRYLEKYQEYIKENLGVRIDLSELQKEIVSRCGFNK